MSSSPRGHALRHGRVSIPSQVYIVTTVTQDRCRLFAGFEQGSSMCRALTRRSLWPDASLLAWVLMPDHLHLLLRLGTAEGLPQVMKRLKSASACRFASDHGISRVWQKGYHDHALRSEEGVREAARYIIANPIRAGLVERVGDYPFWDAVWLDPGANLFEP